MSGGSLNLNPGQPMPQDLVANLGSLANSVDALRASLIQQSSPMSGVPFPMSGIPQPSRKDRRAAPEGHASPMQRRDNSTNGVSLGTLLVEDTIIDTMANNVGMGLTAFLSRFAASNDSNLAWGWDKYFSAMLIKTDRDVQKTPLREIVPEPWMSTLTESVPLAAAA